MTARRLWRTLNPLKLGPAKFSVCAAILYVGVEWAIRPREKNQGVLALIQAPRALTQKYS
jgi:hypothetical protein